MKIKNLLWPVCCLLLIAVNANSTVYKVSSQDECKQAASVVKAGDEIVIINGRYTPWEIKLHANGTASQPVIIRAETAGKVEFSGDVYNPVFEIAGSFTQISGIVFTGCTVFKTEGKKGLLIGLKNSKSCRLSECIFTANEVKMQFMPLVAVSGNGENNRVDHCQFTRNINNQELQVRITASSIPLHTLIDHNVFKDKAKVNWTVINGGECIQVGQDQVLLGTQYAYTIIRDNRFIHCNGDPEVISNKSSGNKYINNYFESCEGELVMRGGHDCVIDSNTFKGGTGGIRVNGTHHTITNNSLSDLKTGIRLMYGMGKGKTEIGFYIAASDCVVKNNRISNAVTGILVGDNKNIDWTGKFDTKKYPSRTMQDVAPFNNTISDNKITKTATPVAHREL